MLHAIERQPKRRRGDPINGKDEFNDMETRTWSFLARFERERSVTHSRQNFQSSQS